MPQHNGLGGGLGGVQHGKVNNAHAGVVLHHRSLLDGLHVVLRNVREHEDEWVCVLRRARRDGVRKLLEHLHDQEAKLAVPRPELDNVDRLRRVRTGRRAIAGQEEKVAQERDQNPSVRTRHEGVGRHHVRDNCLVPRIATHGVVKALLNLPQAALGELRPGIDHDVGVRAVLREVLGVQGVCLAIKHVAHAGRTAAAAQLAGGGRAVRPGRGGHRGKPPAEPHDELEVGPAFPLARRRDQPVPCVASARCYAAAGRVVNRSGPARQLLCYARCPDKGHPGQGRRRAGGRDTPLTKYTD